MDAALFALACTLLAWVVGSSWLARRSITPSMTFLLAGLVVVALPGHQIDGRPSSAGVRLVAEYALALLLFTDASRVSFAWLRQRSGPALRLLTIGLPLTMLLGTLVAVWLPLPGSVWVAGVVATALAPTDAALGITILNDVRLPSRLRTTLNVESGLNDGLATPVVLFCVSAAAASADQESVSHAVAVAIGELGVGVLVGLVVGGVGGRLLVAASQRGWLDPAAAPLGVLALAVLGYAGSVLVHGNGFVACFVAGMAFGNVLRRNDEHEVELVEGLGGILAYAVWFCFGLVLASAVLSHLTWWIVVYAVASLTVIRMVPVAIALVGSGWPRADVLIAGWMGPRGLASVVFALLAYDTIGPGTAAASSAIDVIGFTVFLSVLAHGLLAGPIAALYAREAPVPTDAAVPAPRSPHLVGWPRSFVTRS